MVTQMSLKTPCGHKTTVTAEKVGKVTKIHLDTTCPNLTKWGIDFELDKKDLLHIHNDVFMEKYKNATPSANCYTPATVMMAAWVENGLLAASLAKEAGKIEITFDKIKEKKVDSNGVDLTKINKKLSL